MRTGCPHMSPAASQSHGLSAPALTGLTQEMDAWNSYVPNFNSPAAMCLGYMIWLMETGNGFIVALDESIIFARSRSFICHFPTQATTFITYVRGSASLSISGNEICFSDFSSLAKFSALFDSAASSDQGFPHVKLWFFFFENLYIHIWNRPQLSRMIIHHGLSKHITLKKVCCKPLVSTIVVQAILYFIFQGNKISIVKNSMITWYFIVSYKIIPCHFFRYHIK